ncbi:MAG: SUMF1/EgtB/PvdO family nonheme iron enzyme, partial [Variovorax sp.]
MGDARSLAGEKLAAALRESRARTKAWTFDLDDAQWRVPQQPGVNLVAWELAHLAWFAEFWILRGPHAADAKGRTLAAAPARIAGPDALFDSAQLAHADRWAATLPSRSDVETRLDAQLDACLAALAQQGDGDQALYFHRLALFHEDMHGEAFAWLRATLGYPAPDGLVPPCVAMASALDVPAAQVDIGWSAARRGFAFDNERAAHAVRLGGYEIDAAPVTAGQYLRFVAAGGYDDPAFWPGEAGRWRPAQAHSHPARWRRQPHRDGEARWFDRWLPLESLHAVIHVSAFEAEAYARWSSRRLPSAAEWEHAARSQPGFGWGRSVWEWTSSAFTPYPDFETGPYREY